MNLHEMAGGLIAIVHPDETAMFRASTGFTTQPDGTRVPTYAPDVAVQVQWQETPPNPLSQRDGLAQQTSKSKLWLSGTAAGVVRQEGVGGDMFVRADGSLHLVTLVMEQWPEWVAVEVTRQMLP